MILFPFTYFIQSIPFEEFDLKKEKQRVLSEYDLDKYDDITKNDILDTFEALEVKGFYDSCLFLEENKILKSALVLGDIYIPISRLEKLENIQASQNIFKLIGDNILSLHERYLREQKFNKAAEIIQFLIKFNKNEETIIDSLELQLSNYSNNHFLWEFYITEELDFRIDNLETHISIFDYYFYDYIKRLPPPLYFFKNQFLYFIDVLKKVL